MTWLLALGCASGALEITPNPLSFGEIDFQAGPPPECDPDDGGCAPEDVILRNAGDADLTITSSGYDGDYLCISGHPADTELDLGVLPPGATLLLKTSVCGYNPGDRDSEVTGTIRFSTDGDSDPELTWTFTPIRDIGGGDSG